MLLSGNASTNAQPSSTLPPRPPHPTPDGRLFLRLLRLYTAALAAISTMATLPPPICALSTTTPKSSVAPLFLLVPPTPMSICVVATSRSSSRRSRPPDRIRPEEGGHLDVDSSPSCAHEGCWNTCVSRGGSNASPGESTPAYSDYRVTEVHSRDIACIT